MEGIEIAYCNVCLFALFGANEELKQTTSTEALRKVPYGKKGEQSDTLGLDAIPEIIITGRLNDFDSHAILITEELDDQAHRRWPTDSNPTKQPLMFFSDPTDRSKQLREFIEKIKTTDPATTVGELMNVCSPVDVWENQTWDRDESPASITGATTSISCIRKGEVVFTVILNYITSMVYIAVDVGVYEYDLAKLVGVGANNLTLAEVIKNGRKVCFPSVREQGLSLHDCKRFVTFLGKEGYEENFRDSQIFVEDWQNLLHHREPPGPPRVLFLSDLQQGHTPIGFILSNGAKIGEWIPWLSFVKYAKNENGQRALRAFEISLKRPYTKNGMLMSTPRSHSIFCENVEDAYLDISRLRDFDVPSQFRCMLAILPSDNERIIHVMEQHQYREVTNSF